MTSAAQEHPDSKVSPFSAKLPTLYIVATPIGNLEDISLRALSVLKEVDFILSENTRHSLKLTRKYQIQTPLKSFRQHQRRRDTAWACQKLYQGKHLALISGAGTPGISDPAADLVREVRQKELATVIPIPGPSALSSALSVCGWQTNPCLFTGFLSRRRGRRQAFLQDIRSFSGVIVIYEAVHRIKALLEELKEPFFLAGRDILVAREISKVHEEWLLLCAQSPYAQENWQKQLSSLVLKGEFTVLIEPIRKGLS